ncbi:hypothetical protein AQEC111735_09100 [Aquirufa ecclesiirivi]
MVDGLTTTDNRSAPAADKVPSVTAINAVSALYNFKVVVATPEVKLSVVVEPKAISVGVLFCAVGAVTGEGELVAPEYVKFLAPV